MAEEKKELKPQTKANELANYRRLTRLLPNWMDASDDEIIKAIQTVESLHSQKLLSYYVIKHFLEKGAPRKAIQDFRDSVSKLVANNYKSQEKTDNEKDNWLTTAQLSEVADKLYGEYGGNPKNWMKLQQSVILRILIEYPYRSQGIADIYMSEKPEDLENTRVNWYDPSTNTFYMNQYKTSKTYGQLKYQFPEDMMNEWLEVRPKESRFLFMTNMKTPMSSHYVTQMLSKIFLQHTGKNVSTTMIRHIRASDIANHQGRLTNAEKKFLEEIFQHSPETNDNVYRKL